MEKLTETLSKYGVWLLTILVAWNVYLHQQNLNFNESLHEFKLKVACEYISKPDLKDMLNTLEDNLVQRIESLK